MDRRTFVKNLGLGAVAATAASATTVSTAVSAAGTQDEIKEVVVVGGGFGGASAAKYLSLWGGNKVNVTLIDMNPSHVSCILSNLVLNGQKTISNLTFNLNASAQKYGFNFIQGKVVDVKKLEVGGHIFLENQENPVYFHKLVMSPGIEFIYPYGMINDKWNDSNTPFPHAWTAGLQTENLRNQLKSLPTGGKSRVIMTIPSTPYRCPPGPYERACLIADYLKTKKGGGKLYVFDANRQIQAEPTNFGNAFKNIYKGIIEYHPGVTVKKVVFDETLALQNKKIEIISDAILPISMTSRTDINELQKNYFHLINVIPEQRAALDPIAFADILKDEKGESTKWVPVKLDSYLSKNDPDIYVIGDSHSSSQPKAGHIANSEAKVCANALLKHIGVRTWTEAPAVTNSACFSPITATTASFLTAGFRYDPTTDNVVRVNEAFGEAEQITSDNYKMMLAWANNLFAEVF